MADYISREATLECFGDVPMWTGYSRPYSFEVHMALTGITKVIHDTIAQVPAADVEPVRRWIPCSERLPDIETEVLAVCRRGGVSFVCPAMYEDGKTLTGESIWNWNEIEGYGLYSEDSDDWFIPEGWWEYRQFNDDDVYNNLIDCTVTHWMPLPEPPEEGGTENAVD